MHLRHLSAPGLGLFALLMLEGAARAQDTAPGPVEPQATELAQLRQELEAQKAELARQKAELEAQKAELARRQSATPSSVDAAPPASQPPAAAEEAAPDAAAVEALMHEGDSTELEQDDPVDIYGFFDFGFDKTFLSKESFLYGVVNTRSTTFVLGNLNVYLDAKPTENLRGLLELRFTNSPHGQETFGTDLPGTATDTPYSRVDRAAYDVTSPNGRNQLLLGSIQIERAQVTYTFAQELQLRVGYFLTPFGIWNLDHGTPTLISLFLPDSQVDEYFPQRQMGVEALGSLHTGSAWSYGYHATLSNGRTVGQVDLSEDKALGGRLYAATRSDGLAAQFGVSGYYGTYQEEEKYITAFSPSFVVDVRQTVDGEEWALGADASVDVGDLRLRAEGTIRHVQFEDDKRPAVVQGPPSAKQADRYNLDGYLIAAYQTPWAGMEPYTYLEMLHGPNYLGDTVIFPTVGVNFHFMPQLQLKVQYGQTFFTDLVTERADDPSRHDFQRFTARLVFAF